MSGNKLIDIPEMSHPLSSGWQQPPKKYILVDDKHALMTKNTFRQLLEYSHSIPSGVYAGKMWKIYNSKKKWFLAWFSNCPENPNICLNKYREILIV